MGSKVCVGQRPVEPKPVVAVERKISLMHPQPHTVVMESRSSGTRARVESVSDFMVTRFGYRGFRPLQLSSPDLRADEVAELPFRAGL
jgi:hypothetical protein